MVVWIQGLKIYDLLSQPKREQRFVLFYGIGHRLICVSFSAHGLIEIVVREFAERLAQTRNRFVEMSIFSPQFYQLLPGFNCVRICLPGTRLHTLQVFPGGLQFRAKIVEMALKMTKQLSHIGNGLLVRGRRLFGFLVSPFRGGLS